MSPTLTFLALSLVGVDLGYRPAPQGGLEFIVQIDPNTLGTLQPNDPIPLEVRREAQQVRASQITLTLGSGPLPHQLPPQAASPSTGPSSIAPPYRSAPPGTSSAPPYQSMPRYGSAPNGMLGIPATAPNVPATPLANSQVMPAGAAMPLTAPNGPLPNGGLPAAPGGNPVHVAPPSGPPASPATGNEQMQPAAGWTTPTGSGQGGSRINGLPTVGGSSGIATSFDGKTLVLYLVIVFLAATNGYVGWLFWIARQRYIGLVSRTFATAQ